MRRGSGRRGAALLAAGLLLSLVTAAPAAAHNRLVGTDPADGATLARTPSAVVLTFDEPAVALGSQVLVSGPEGPEGRGAPRLVDDTVQQDLAGGAPAGRYTVEWRVTSGDGHPITGRFSFTTETAAAGPRETSDQAPAAAQQRSPAWSWLLLALVLVAAAGTVTVVLRRRGRPEVDEPEEEPGPTAPAG